MEVEEIKPQSAIEAVKAGTHVFIDVREPYELEEVAYGLDYIHIP